MEERTQVRRSGIGLISAELRSYLQTDQKIREYRSLYRRFKDNPALNHSQTALKRALAFYVKHRPAVIQCHFSLREKWIKNSNYLLITDYTIPHPNNRFFILYLNSGQVASSAVAHGYGSNLSGNCPPDYQIRCRRNDVIREKCRIPIRISNTRNSGDTSRGFYITGEPYISEVKNFRSGKPDWEKGNANAIRLDGLEYRVNHRARSRGIVLHRANYYDNTCSSSAGCPAINPMVFEEYKNDLKDGVLLYIHTIEDKNKGLPNCIKFENPVVS